jgi:hypothetical protein
VTRVGASERAANEFQLRKDAKPRVMLEDYGYKLYPAGGFDYLLRRTDID